MKLYSHQQTLVNKAREAYMNGYRAPCIVSPCGSGKSVIIAEIAKMTTANKNTVLFLVHRKELKDQIYRTFKQHGVDMKYAKIMMVQTAARRLDKMKKPSLIITDENHHSLANTYKKIYRHFNTLLLGFTATPVRLNGGGLGDVNDILIEGPTVEWLINNHYLAPYKYYAPKIIRTDKLKTRRGEFIVSDLPLEQKAYGDVIKYYKQLADGEQAICYCSSIDHSKQIAERFRQVGIPAAHIDANTTKYRRDQIIQQFRDKEIRILSNVDLIGEGFDVPDCSTVIMLRPTKSLSLFIQQSMRGMRYREGKTSIIIDHVGNAERFGLPDMEREWSLKPKKEKKSAQTDEIKIKICANCFSAIPKKDNICPICGQPYRSDAIQQIEEVKDIELKQITKEDFNFTLNTKTAQECRSMQELVDWCVSNGYKKGYAFYLGKNMGLIKNTRRI